MPSTLHPEELLYDVGRRQKQEDPDTPWREFTNLDIYGKWMSADGGVSAMKQPFVKNRGCKRYSSISYSEKSERFLVTCRTLSTKILTWGDGRSVRPARKRIRGNVYAIAYGKP